MDHQAGHVAGGEVLVVCGGGQRGEATAYTGSTEHSFLS